MDNMKFNTPAGQTVDRKLLILYGNTGSYEAPKWNAIGKRVEESAQEYDWGEESKKDILGDTWSTMKAPTVTQSFEPCELDAGDEYQQKLWNLAVKDQDAQALCNQDLLVVHAYAGDAETGVFAERYPASMVKPDSLGGSGGGSLTMPVSCTFGGRREKGTAAMTVSGVVFTKEA